MDVRKIETEAQRIVEEELKRTKEKIIANHIAAGQRASGQTEDSMQESVSSDGGMIIGTLDGRPYFAALETGSGPWKNPHYRQRKDGTLYPSAPKWFINIIEDWAAVKGIAFDSPWAVATKQMMEGSRLFRDGGRDDIFSNEIPELVKRVADRLAGLYDAQLVESILRQS
jgi:hypothetical protein